MLFQEAPSLAPDAPSEYGNLYTQPADSPSTLTPLVSSTSPNRSAGAGNAGLHLAYAGASSDFSRLFFAANDALTQETAFAPEALDGGVVKKNLYEWRNGELRLVNVLPGNTTTVAGAQFGAAPTEQQSVNNLADLSHAVSGDGSRVFWSDEAGQVYVRENGEVTEEIPDPAKFLTASADGSRVLLADGRIFNVGDLRESPIDLDEGAGGFVGIAGQSEDLSHVYFVDTAVLTGEQENDHGAKAAAGRKQPLRLARRIGRVRRDARCEPQEGHISGR